MYQDIEFKVDKIKINFTEATLSLQYKYSQISGDLNLGVDIVPVPYGYFYPIGEYFGTNFGFRWITSFKINNNEISEDNWRELNINEANGVNTDGVGAWQGFAHSIRTLNNLTVKSNDIIEMTCRIRLLNSMKVYGLRICATKFTPPLINDEDLFKRLGYYHPSPYGNNQRTPNNTIVWLYPKEDKYKIVLFKLNKSASGRRNTSNMHFSLGRIWRPYRVVDSTQGYIQLFNIETLMPRLSKSLAFKLAVFDVETGAISELSTETITYMRNCSFALQTLMMK